MSELTGKQIVLGIRGGIAAYKALGLSAVCGRRCGVRRHDTAAATIYHPLDTQTVSALAAFAELGAETGNGSY